MKSCEQRETSSDPSPADPSPPYLSQSRSKKRSREDCSSPRSIFGDEEKSCGEQKRQMTKQQETSSEQTRQKNKQRETSSEQTRQKNKQRETSSEQTRQRINFASLGVSPRTILTSHNPREIDSNFIRLDMPKTPDKLDLFYIQLREQMIDKKETREVGRMITIRDQSLYKYIVLSTGERKIVVKMKCENFYIPSFKAGETGWQVFDDGKQVGPGYVKLPLTPDYPPIETAAGVFLKNLVFDNTYLNNCVDCLSRKETTPSEFAKTVLQLLIFLPEGMRLRGIVKKIVESAPLGEEIAALIREWGRLSKLWILYRANKSLVESCFGGVKLELILSYVEENIAVLKCLTFNKSQIIEELAIEFCNNFVNELRTRETNLFKIFGNSV